MKPAVRAIRAFTIPESVATASRSDTRDSPVGNLSLDRVSPFSVASGLPSAWTSSIGLGKSYSPVN